MSVSYDLAIICGTGLGRQIALKAAALKARVALVEISPPAYHWLTMPAIYRPVIEKGIGSETASRWLQTTLAHLDELDSPAVLAALGIDTIQGCGEFCRLPRFGFLVKNRLLRARSYLILPTDGTITPEIPGIDQISFYNTENLGDRIFSLAPQRRWVVIGGNATGVEFAQLLQKLGARVTLVVKGDRILPHEDPDAANLVQAQLEAEGVEIIARSPVEIVKQIDDTKWVQAGNRAIETDEVFLAVRRYPQVANLNLSSVGVKLGRGGIEVNSKLQTSNSRIYACNSHQHSLATKEAEIACHNALFFPTKTVDRHQIPTLVSTQPPLARIGLTPAQARSIYGKKVVLLREYFQHLSAAQISGNLTGMCQIVARDSGEIVGAQVFGEGAIAAIEALSLHIQSRGKIQDLAKLSSIYPSYSEMFARLRQIWLEKRLSHHHWQAECLDKFFDWRRAWSK